MRARARTSSSVGALLGGNLGVSVAGRLESPAPLIARKESSSYTDPSLDFSWFEVSRRLFLDTEEKH
jgi:hypothetical protein